jgi:hypothetical protein
MINWPRVKSDPGTFGIVEANHRDQFPGNEIPHRVDHV